MGDLALATRGEGQLEEGGRGKTVFSKLLNSKILKGKRIFSALAMFCIKSDTLAHLDEKKIMVKVFFMFWSRKLTVC